mgnify:CR=1 FL=1
MASRRAAKRPPTTTLVLLVRHGQTPTTGTVLPGRAKGLHLSDAGREQATAAAGRIATLVDGSRSVAAVYASPLERTRETAAPIGRAVGQRVQVERGLLECDFGDWTGAKLNELRKHPEWSVIQNHPSSFTFPGGESFSAMHTRITTTLRTLAGRHRGETIVAVSHADPIKAALADASGAHLDAFQRFVVSPCSVSAIAYDASGSTILLAANTTGSLTELRPS